MLASLTSEMTQSQRKLFCLDYDREAETCLDFQTGESDAYGIWHDQHLGPGRPTAPATVAAAAVSVVAVGGAVYVCSE